MGTPRGEQRRPQGLRQPESYRPVEPSGRAAAPGPLPRPPSGAAAPGWLPDPPPADRPHDPSAGLPAGWPHPAPVGAPAAGQPGGPPPAAPPRPPGRRGARVTLAAGLLAALLLCAAGVVTTVVRTDTDAREPRASSSPTSQAPGRSSSGPTLHRVLSEPCSPVSAVRATGLTVRNLKTDTDVGAGYTQSTCTGDVAEGGRFIGRFSVTATVFTEVTGQDDARDRASRFYQQGYTQRARDGATPLTGVGTRAHVTRSQPGPGRKYMQLIALDENLFLDMTWVLPIHTDQKATAVAAAVARSYIADS